MSKKHDPAAPAADLSTTRPAFVAGSELGIAPSVSAPEASFWIWCGLIDGPSIGRYAIQLGGLSFCQVSELVRVVDGQTQRIRYRGGITRATRAQLEELARRLPRKVLRVQRAIGEVLGDATAKGTATGMRAISVLLNATSPDEQREMRARGIWTPAYEPSAEDSPIASHVFLKILGTRRARVPMDAEIPGPLTETGLALPGPDCPAAEGTIAWPETIGSTETL